MDVTWICQILTSISVCFRAPCTFMEGTFMEWIHPWIRLPITCDTNASLDRVYVGRGARVLLLRALQGPLVLMEELHRQRPQPLVEVRVQIVDGQLVGLVAERVLELARHLQRNQRTRQRWSSDSVAISAELPIHM